MVYVLNRDQAANLTISSPLDAHKSHHLVFSVTGLDVGFDNPVFAAIELDYADADQVQSYHWTPCPTPTCNSAVASSRGLQQSSALIFMILSANKLPELMKGFWVSTKIVSPGVLGFRSILGRSADFFGGPQQAMLMCRNACRTQLEKQPQRPRSTCLCMSWIWASTMCPGSGASLWTTGPTCSSLCQVALTGPGVSWSAQRTSSSTATRWAFHCILQEHTHLARHTCPAGAYMPRSRGLPFLELTRWPPCDHASCVLQDHAEVRAVIPRRSSLLGDRGVLIVNYAMHKQKTLFFFLLQVRLLGAVL